MGLSCHVTENHTPRVLLAPRHAQGLSPQPCTPCPSELTLHFSPTTVPVFLPEGTALRSLLETLLPLRTQLVLHRPFVSSLLILGSGSLPHQHPSKAFLNPDQHNVRVLQEPLCVSSHLSATPRGHHRFHLTFILHFFIRP